MKLVSNYKVTRMVKRNQQTGHSIQTQGQTSYDHSNTWSKGRQASIFLHDQTPEELGIERMCQHNI